MAKGKRSSRKQVRERDVRRRDDSREQRGKDLREKLTTTKSWFPLYGRERIRDEEGNRSWGDVEMRGDWLTDFLLGDQWHGGEPVPFDPVRRHPDRSGYWGVRSPVVPAQKVMDNPLSTVEPNILAGGQLGSGSRRRSLEAALARERGVGTKLSTGGDTVDGWYGMPDEGKRILGWRTRPVSGPRIDELPPVSPYHIPRRRETLRRRK